MFCQKQHEKFPLQRIVGSNEKIKNDIENIKENLGVFNQTIVRINCAICKIESETCRHQFNNFVCLLLLFIV